MSILGSARRRIAESRKVDEALYAQALKESEAGIRVDGLWAQALVEADRTNRLAQIVYLELRVRALRDQAVLQEVEAEDTADKVKESAAIEASESIDAQRRAEAHARIDRMTQENLRRKAAAGFSPDTVLKPSLPVRRETGKFSEMFDKFMILLVAFFVAYLIWLFLV
jgi:hypothetical protein